MLRMMFAPRRRVVSAPSSGESSAEDDAESLPDLVANRDIELEPWPAFIQRVTHHIDELLDKISMEDWVVVHRRRKWRFLHKIATAGDKRWSKSLLAWMPYGFRRVGRPKTRWADCIEQLAGGDWLSLAEDANLWALSEEAYACRAGMSETVGRKQRRL